MEISEALYETALRIDWNIVQLISTICLLIMCSGFMNYKKPLSKCTGNFLIGSTYFLVYMGLYWLPGHGDYTTNFISLAAVFFVCFLIDGTEMMTKLFLFSTFQLVRWMVISTSNHILFIFYDKVTAMIYNTAGRDNPNLQLYYFIEYCGYLLLCWLISGAVMYLFARTIKGIFVYKRDIAPGELVFMFIPVFVGVAAHEIINYFMDAFEEKTGEYLLDAYPEIKYLSMFFYLTIIAAIIGMIVLSQRIRKKREDETAGMMLENQIKDMQTHISEIEKLYTDIRGIKHDINNHIEVINSLLSQGKSEEAKEYSRSLSEAVNAFDFPVKTGNPITDVIIYEKMNQAKERGIEFTSDFKYPADTKINAFDISIIISNALSNAIEAATDGFVRISSIMNKNAYLIIVENSFDGRLELYDDGLPKTGKGDKSSHGFGLKNIRSVANKYYGNVIIEQNDNVVVLTVMLMAAE